LICSFFPELSESTLFTIHHCRCQQLPLKIDAGLEYQLVDESTKRETVCQARSIQPSENRPLYTFSISDRRTTRSTRLHPCHLVGPRIAVARLHRRLNRVPSWCPPSSCIPRLDVQGLLILASSAWDLHSFDRGGPMFDRSMSVQSVETFSARLE
jgi:hypothetical protein